MPLFIRGRSLLDYLGRGKRERATINILTVGVEVNLLTRSEQQMYKNASNIEYDHVGHPPPPAFALALIYRETGCTLE